MPFNGSGVFNRLYDWETDALNGINIMADRMDAEFDGIAAGLSICLTRDGQSGMSANLNLGNNKIINLAAPTLGTDATNRAFTEATYAKLANSTITGDWTFEGKIRQTLTGALGLGTDTHPFQIGTTAGANLTMNQGGIQVRNNGVKSQLSLNTLGGNISALGDTTDRLSINGLVRIPFAGVIALADDTHNLQLGVTTAFNMAANHRGLQSRNNGAAAALQLNVLGGNVDLMKDIADRMVVNGQLYMPNALNDGGAFNAMDGIVVGNTAANSVYIGRNHITARNAGATATLNVNANGSVNMGGDIGSGHSITIGASVGPGSVPAGTLQLGNGFRTTSGGNVSIGVGFTTTPVEDQVNGIGLQPAGTINVYRAASQAMMIGRGGNGQVVQFFQTATQVGNISVTASATAYNTSSDYRLKENIAPVEYPLETLMMIKPCSFNFKVDPDNRVNGFLAHELAEVVPNAVTGVKDEVDEDGKPVHQSVDASKLVPLLVAAVQQLSTELANLRTELGM